MIYRSKPPWLFAAAGENLWVDLIKRNQISRDQYIVHPLSFRIFAAAAGENLLKGH